MPVKQLCRSSTYSVTYRVLARQLGHALFLEGNFGGGEFDAALKLLIFTERQLMIVKACDPARLNAPTKPCNRASVSVVRDGGCRGTLPLPGRGEDGL